MLPFGFSHVPFVDPLATTFFQLHLLYHSKTNHFSFLFLFQSFLFTLHVGVSFDMFWRVRFLYKIVFCWFLCWDCWLWDWSARFMRVNAQSLLLWFLVLCFILILFEWGCSFWRGVFTTQYWFVPHQWFWSFVRFECTFVRQLGSWSWHQTILST